MSDLNSLDTSLTAFIAKAKGEGVSKASHYRVEFTLPKVIRDMNFFTISQHEKIQMFCEQTQLPGMTMATTPTFIYGEVQEMPYEKMYDNIILTILVDKDMYNKYFFDAWISGIQNPQTRVFSYYDDYVSTMKITVEDSEHNDTFEVTLHEAYPKIIYATQLGYAEQNLMRCNVVFQYKYATSAIPISRVEEYANSKPDQFTIEPLKRLMDK